jgi:protein O-mannosyl-transferase
MARRLKKQSPQEITDTRRPETKLETPHRRPLLAICVFLVFAVAVVFGRTLLNDFVCYDDNLYVYQNPQVAEGLTAEGIGWAFTHYHTGNWIPLTWISHMLDCQLYGLNPIGHHLTNVLLHAATVVLLFLVLQRMTGALGASAFVAALFAVHPLRVESVAWIAERKDVLSGLFFMLTLSAYVGYVRCPFSRFRYAAVMVFFLLGLLAKPMLVTLPFVLLLLDYWPLQRLSLAAENVPLSNKQPRNFLSMAGHLVLEKLPLLALAVIDCAVTFSAQQEALGDSTLPERAANAVVSYVAYLGQMFYPANLAVLYPFPMHGLPTAEVLGAILVLAVLTGAAIALRRRSPYFLMGWLWYLGMLAPVIGLIRIGSQARADRYTYLPQIGLYIALAWGFQCLLLPRLRRRWIVGVAAVSIVGVLMASSWRQTSYWRDSKTLWTHTLACTSENSVAHNNLATFLYESGRPEDLQEAADHYRQSIEFNPQEPQILFNYGLCLQKLNRPDDAVEPYQLALKYKPDDAVAHNQLGEVYAQIGLPKMAVEHYLEAVRLRPDYIAAYCNLANAYITVRRPAAAVAAAQKALDLALSQGQTVHAQQIKEWIKQNQSRLSTAPEATPAPP